MRTGEAVEWPPLARHTVVRHWESAAEEEEGAEEEDGRQEKGSRMMRDSELSILIQLVITLQDEL